MGTTANSGADDVDLVRTVLASESPRRSSLMSLMGLEPVIRPANVDESLEPGEHPADAVMRLAEAKATHHVDHDEVVVGADTVVALEEETGWTILGKPRDPADARSILRCLSGRTHWVFTGHVAARRLRGRVATAGALGITQITFRSISDDEIDTYVSSNEGADKAGAYGIQGQGARFVGRRDGSISNVVGLDVDLTADLINMLRKVRTS